MVIFDAMKWMILKMESGYGLSGSPTVHTFSIMFA